MATIRLLRLPVRYRRPALWGTLVLSPSLVLLGTAGVTSAWSAPSVFEPVGVNAGNAEWLDTLTAPQARAADGTTVALAPTSPVLPNAGDLQVLTITQGDDPGEDVPVIPAVPPVGDVTPTYRLSRSGIPVRVLQSYVAAASMANRSIRGCNIHWSLVAGIGRVESNHARFGGASVTASGRVVPPILGPRLDGSRAGWAVIRDSDRGLYDGDTRFDRAVGPMQFLPGTWKHYGADGDGDHVANPQDTDDAALGTARYLCAGGTDLSRRADQWRAVMRYNHSRSYAALVIGLADTYRSGTAVPVPAPPPGATAPSDGESGSPARPPGPVLPPVTAPKPVQPRPVTTPVPLPSPGPGTPSTPASTPSTQTSTPSATATTPTDPATATSTDPALTPSDPVTVTPTDPATTPVDPVPTPVDPVPTTPADPAPATPADPAPVTPTDPAPATPVDPVPASSPVDPVPAATPATTTQPPAADPTPTP